MPEAAAMPRPPTDAAPGSGPVGIAVFDASGALVEADAIMRRLLPLPFAEGRLADWLSGFGLAHRPSRALRAEVPGVDGRRVEIVVATLPDGQAVVTAAPPPEPVPPDVAAACTEWFWELDADLRVRFLSRRFEAITGIDPRRLLGKRREELVGPPACGQDAAALRAHLQDLAERRPFRDFIYAAAGDDGQRRFFRVSGVPVFVDGEFRGYRGVGAVLGEKVAVREILEDVPIPLLICRRHDGAILHANGLAARRFGCAAAVDACFVDAAAYRRLLAGLAENGEAEAGEIAFHGGDGHRFWADVNAREIIFGGENAVLIGLQDATGRVTAQQKLADQLHFQEVLLNALPNPVFYKNRDGAYIGCNDAFCGYLGRERDQILGRTVHDLAAPDLAAVYHAADEALFSEPRLQVYETAVTDASGSLRQVLFYKAPFFERDGRLAGLVGTMLDITDQKLLEAALRSRSNDLRTILEAGPVGVMITGRDGDDVLFANARCGEILELPKMALIGGRADDHFVQGGRRELLSRLARQGRVRDAEVRLRRPSGEFWALISVEAISFDSQPAVLYWIYDIAERRRAEEEYRKLFLAVEHSPASVVITDSEGVIEYVNPRFCQITGYTAAEAIGKTPRVCRSGRTPPEVYAELWSTIKAGRIWQGELLNRRRNGDLYWESINIAPISDAEGRITHFVAVKSDITAQKMAEQAIVEAKERAEDAARAKSEFLAMMSHEIRTPMNGILGMIGLLRDTPLDEEQRDLVETARGSGEALLAILNDILDFSKLEARQMRLEAAAVDLPELIGGVCELMRARADEKGLRLERDVAPGVPEAVLGDSARLRQVLLNLLSNAIKFTESGEVRLRVSPLPAEAGHAALRFEVRDTGIGIPEAARGKLFSEFAQADSTIARRFGGTGLGLAICKKIVMLMGGEIGVDSVVGDGSMFWFTVSLPLARRDAPAVAETGSEAEEGDGMQALRILLAEDNPVNQKVAMALLTKQGHSVTLAKDGFEAVAAAAAGGFDLVLMDVQMPGLDGFEATRRIRELGERGRVPIIAMTANALKGDEQRCIEAGMDDYVAKPIHPQALYAAIARQAGPRDDDGILDSGALRKLEEQVGAAAMAELVQDCLATVPTYMQALRAAAAAGDVGAARNAAHDIKSLAATFGAGRIAAHALAVETAAREGRAQEAFGRVPELEAALDEGLSALRKLYPAADA